MDVLRRLVTVVVTESEHGWLHGQRKDASTKLLASIFRALAFFISVSIGLGLDCTSIDGFGITSTRKWGETHKGNNSRQSAGPGLGTSNTT